MAFEVSPPSPRPPPRPAAPAEFPLGALPSWLREMIVAAAESTQTDAAAAGVFSLAVLAACVSRKGVVRSASGTQWPLSLWVLVVLGSGEGKSPLFSALAGPLLELQDRLSQAVSGQTAGAPGRQAVGFLPRPGDGASASALSDTFRRGVSLEEAAEELIRQQLAAGGAAVEFLVDDITPAGLVQVMAAQSMGIAWLSAEGGFDAWIGKGARGTNDMSLLNRSWDGVNVYQGRAGARRVAQRACLTMGIFVHPNVARAVFADPHKAERGYSYRFLVFWPESRAGRSRYPFAAIDGSVSDRYRRHLWALVSLPGGLAPNGQAPWALRLSEEADEAWGAFYNRTQDRAEHDERLGAALGWLEKMRQSVVRIAGLLHLAKHVAEGAQKAVSTPVSRETMEGAIQIGEFLIPHALKAFEEAALHSSRQEAKEPSPLPMAALLRRMLDVIDESFGDRPFRPRELYRDKATRLGKPSAELVHRALGQLVAAGELEQLPPEATRGRSAEEVFRRRRVDR